MVWEDRTGKSRQALSPVLCYKAFLERDIAYDGVFFVAVRTTGVYCRTTCKSRKAKFENCLFFPDAELTEEKGYRACLRCRPDLAPDNPADVIARLASEAVKRIYDGALTDGSVENLASELGVTSRHLRRALKRIYHQTPLELAQNYRLQLAETLLIESKLPITEISGRSGFSSIRRFNEVFREKYGINPSKLRKSRDKES